MKRVGVLFVREVRSVISSVEGAPVTVEVVAGLGNDEAVFETNVTKAPKVGDEISVTIEWGVEQ